MKTTPKKNGGFTLVELIVVIAILAILAAVAIPAYSGYIEKAEKANDLQLLGAVNTAFAAACLNEGIDMSTLTDSTALMPFTAEKKISIESVRPVAVQEAFALFFSGNENSAFEVFNGLVYNADEKVFEEAEGNRVIAYGGGYVVVSEEAIEALKGSTYYGEGMTSDKLMNQVDTVAHIAGLMGTVQNVMATEEYVDTALRALGLEVSGTFQEKVDRMNARASALALEKMGYETLEDVPASKRDEYANHLKNISNNALVIYTAQSTSSMDAADAKALLNGVNSQMIRDAMDGNLNNVDKATGMNQAALAYGMYYAYVNSNACTQNLEKNNIVATDVTTALDTNTEFMEYMASEQGTKDMEAYLQALNVISSSTQSPEAVEKMVVEGFVDPDLVAILSQNMGK